MSFKAILLQENEGKVSGGLTQLEESDLPEGEVLVRVDYSTDRPEIRVSLDRARAASRFGIAPDQVADAMLTAFHGIEVGRMWFDDEPDSRVGRGRVDEALETGAETVAVGCPFCLTMVTDGINAKGSEVAVKDVAELLAEAIGDPEDGGSL